MIYLLVFLLIALLPLYFLEVALDIITMVMEAFLEW